MNDREILEGMMEIVVDSSIFRTKSRWKFRSLGGQYYFFRDHQKAIEFRQLLIGQILTDLRALEILRKPPAQAQGGGKP
jgi:hypothetical protein